MNPILLDRKAFQGVLGLKGFLGKILSGLVYDMLGMDRLNEFYSMNPRSDGPDFSSEILRDLNVTFDVPEGQLNHIPAEGGFITVSNHHFGAIDGLLLNLLIGRIRPDYQILTTYFLALIPNLKDWFIPVDNFASGGARSVSGIRAALGHIASGGALGLFPAGEVATWQ